ncbi:MAG TPA: hypothetical protein VN962_11270, partial [Polyangia bacterium]|nr:hypothetical protein [Polyangia bacterium]
MGQRIDQRRVWLVRRLDPLLAPDARLTFVAKEQPPVDGEVGRGRAEPHQSAVPAATSKQLHPPSHLLVQPVQGADHGMAEPIGGHRKLDRHERMIAGVEEGQWARHRPSGQIRAHDGRQELVDDQPLIVPTH